MANADTIADIVSTPTEYPSYVFLRIVILYSHLKSPFQAMG